MKNLLILLITAVLLGGCFANRQPITNIAAIQAGLAEKEALNKHKTSLKTSLNPAEQLSFRLDYARLLIKDKRLPEAERLLNALRKHEKIAAQAYPLLAEVYELEDKWPRALIAWQESVRLSSNPSRKLTARLAKVALRCKKYETADKIYKQWLTIKENKGGRLHITALNNLGFSYLLQKNYPQAKQYLDQALVLDPLNKKAAANLNLLLKLHH